jgi:fission process protein 1
VLITINMVLKDYHDEAKEVDPLIKRPTRDYGDRMEFSVPRSVGYSAAIGEAVRTPFPNVVGPAYTVTYGYIGLATIVHTYRTYQATGRTTTALMNGIDTMVFHSLASILIPCTLVRQITSMSASMLNSRPQLSTPVRTWGPVGIGLACVPLMMRPVDKFTHFVMDKTVRKIYHYHS